MKRKPPLNQSTGVSVTRIAWDGTLPVRRYAIFNSILYGDYAIVIKGDDIDRAEKWGGFVSWLGGTKEAIKRKINYETQTACSTR
ncbi:MAG: hypothetical protein EOM12_17140 [Verrucomicrobiae bacterium]|nr:hypothetical protein [Verrucomicrobiae bacterium]